MVTKYKKNRRFTDKSYSNEHAIVFARRYDEGQRQVKASIIYDIITNVNINNKQVLDLGCGIGYFSNLCYEAGAKVVAADHAESMIIQARQRYGDRFSIIRCDAHNLPFSNNTFDIVLSLDVIEHLYEIQKASAEIMRVIKRRGIVIITTDKPGFSVAGLLLWLFRRLPNKVRRYFVKYDERRYSTPLCTHVRVYTPLELTTLMHKNGFQLMHFNTFPNRQSYGTLGKIIEKIFVRPLKKYKWNSALYVFQSKYSVSFG